MAWNERDTEHVFERLRSGVVPERGLEAFAVGIDVQRSEIHRQLKLAENDEGVFKFLRGGYGCGKSFLCRLACLDAIGKGFAASFVVVSDSDLRFHQFDDVYRKVIQELGTRTCPRGALGDVIDRWISKVEEMLIDGGADEESEDFDARVAERLEQELVSITGGKAPQDMGRVLSTIFRLKQEGRLVEAGALISWLSGSENVAASAKKVAGIKGDIGSREAMDYLRGILEIVKAAGYEGLVIVIDEVETLLRSRRDVRGKSLNGIRQIIDAADGYPGLLWMFTGTPEFFDTRRGVAGLQPLNDRIQFQKRGEFVNPRQPQLDLRPFNDARLREVALKLLEIYPTLDRPRLERKVTSDFIDRLVAKVSAGLNGDVGVIPRQFLRQLVDVFDLVEEEADYDPMTAEGFELKNVNETEERLAAGRDLYDHDPEDDTPYTAVVF